MVTGLTSIEINYSKEVNGGDIVDNYVFSGSAAGNLAVDSITKTDTSSYQIVLSGTAVDGDLILTINNITDLVGNALQDSTVSYHIDATKPTLLYSDIASGAYLNDFSAIELAFSESVNGAADIQNYSFSGPGQGSLAVQQVEVLPGPAANSRYKVIFSGSANEAQVTLSLTGVSDVAGNVMDPLDVSVTVDRTAPTVNVSPISNNWTAALQQVTLAFSEPVAGALNAANYGISVASGSGDIAVASVDNLGGNSYQVNFSGGVTHGSQVDFTIGYAVQDNAGNQVAGSRSFTYWIDLQPPTILDLTPLSGSSVAFLDIIAVTFDESMNGSALVAGNYSLSGDGINGLTITGVQRVASSNTYNLLLSGEVAAGSVTVTLNNIADYVGNTMITGNTISYTTLTPMVFSNTESLSNSQPVLNDVFVTSQGLVLAGAGVASSTASDASLYVRSGDNTNGYSWAALTNGGFVVCTGMIKEIAEADYSAINPGDRRIRAIGGLTITGGQVGNLCTSTDDGVTWSSGQRVLVNAGNAFTSTAAGEVVGTALSNNSNRVFVTTAQSFPTTSTGPCLLSYGPEGDSGATNCATTGAAGFHLPKTVNKIVYANGYYFALGLGSANNPWLSATANPLPSRTVSAWTALSNLDNLDLYTLAYGAGGYVMGGANGVLLHSTDLLANVGAADTTAAITVLTSHTTETINEIAWNGSEYLAVGNNGLIMNSSDGVNWVLQRSYTSVNLNAVAWIAADSTWIIVGDAGTVLTRN